MSRRLIALLIALYAIAFAFGAMAAIRWPSLMMVANLLLEDEAAMAGVAGIDWRQLGIVYGAPYFLAALCLYAAALSLSNKKRGARVWYFMGVVAGFPCVFLVDFEPGWWQDPSAGEGAVAGAAAGAVLLGIAVWELCRKPKRKPEPVGSSTSPESHKSSMFKPRRQSLLNRRNATFVAPFQLPSRDSARTLQPKVDA